MIKQLTSLYQKQTSATGLALFRIAYGSVLLCEVLQSFYFRNLFFGEVEYKTNSFALLFLFVFSIPLVISLIIGFQTRVVTVLIYILNLFTFSLTNYFEYHVDYGYTGINFLLMFMPISRTLSIDSIIYSTKQAYRYKSYNIFQEKQVSILNNYILVGVGVGIVYFDSIFYKLASPMWLSGLGFWKPASLPQATYLDLSIILNSEFLSYALGYITLVFELVFLFFVWFKRARLPLILVGLGLHIGILIAYPIPWFALTVTCLYLLLIPDFIWKKFTIRSKKPLQLYFNLNSRKERIFASLIYNADFFRKISFIENTDTVNSYVYLNNQKIEGWQAWKKVFSKVVVLIPLYLLTKLQKIDSHLNRIYASISESYPSSLKEEWLPIASLHKLKIKAIFIFLLYVGVSQLVCISQSLLMIRFYQKYEFNAPFKVFPKLSYVMLLNRTFFGIVPHPVFMDFHFDGYNHIAAITYTNEKGEEKWLPIIDEQGHASWYVTGRQWVNWTFRVNNPDIAVEYLAKGIKKYTHFYAQKNKIDLNDATFNIKIKKIDVPTTWEKNFLKKQMAKPWQDVGKATWKEGEFSIDIPDIESL